MSAQRETLEASNEAQDSNTGKEITPSEGVVPEGVVREEPTEGSGSQSPFAVSLEFFTGPMDLLLHLVSQQEVSIEEVKMSLVAEQYLDIVSRNAERIDLEAAAEYLVIAATLMAIKSRSLLPSEQAAEEEEIADTWEDNRFFEDLRARLKAYEKTKLRAHALMKTPQLGIDTFRRIDRKALQPTPEMLAEPEDMHGFAMLFGKLLKRIGDAASSFRIALEPISVVSYMMDIIDVLGKEKETHSPFSHMIRRFIPESMLERIRSKTSRDEGLAEAKGVVIGSFIASLELVKRGVLSVSKIQSEDQGAMSVGTNSFSLELAISTDENSLKLDTLNSEFDEVPEDESDQVDSYDDKVVDISKYRTEPEVSDPEVAEVQEEEFHEKRANEKEVGGA